MIQICTWNVRGLNNQFKRGLVKSVLAKFSRFIICLQENKFETVSRSFLRSLAGSWADKCQIIKAEGAAGGLLSRWNSNLYDCTEVLVRKFSLTTRMVHRSSNTSFYLTNVYGPPSWGGKASFCSKLAELKDSCIGLWVMCGDFDLTGNPLERKGKSWCGKLMSMFSDLINELELIDLPLGNQDFTWSTMQDRSTLAKLDRFLVSTEWDQAFPFSKVMAAPRILLITR